MNQRNIHQLPQPDRMNRTSLLHMGRRLAEQPHFKIIDVRRMFLQRAILSTQAESQLREEALLTSDIEKSINEVYNNPIRHKDYFGVKNMVKIKDLFEARVHLGHKEGTLDDRMRPFIFGSRLGHLVFDLQQTAEMLRDALNFTSHVVYRGGLVLFMANYHQHCHLIETTAQECKEFAHTRRWKGGTFTDSTNQFGTTIRLPDVIIMLNTLNDIMHEHPAVQESARMNIPVVAICDTNSNPNLITYPVPGNDDSAASLEYYCNLFKNVILKAKEEREKHLAAFS